MERKEANIESKATIRYIVKVVNACSVIGDAAQPSATFLLLQHPKLSVLPERDWSGDDFKWSQSVADLLRDTFGLETWRTNQKEIVNATLSGRDVFVVMRTGGGKSLCYQLPALLQGGITVVVSPLISLIEDQMRYLNNLVPGSAAMLSAGMDKKETADVYRRMRGEPVEGGGEGNKLVMVLVTPEKVVKSKMFMAALDKTAKNRRLARVVIDEAHCCSQWGHDFRPEYCKLGILKRQFSHVPVLAVTATCTDFIRNDVMKILNLTPADVVCFKSSFNRSNLRYEVLKKSEVMKDALEQLVAFIRNNNYSNEAGIVYAFSRKEASDVAAGLASRGIPAAFYHAGLEEGDRSRIQQAWMSGSVPVIVATIAFGMGINHLEVRFVVHFSISKSLENYYQESGRAGRDGRSSRCAVFYRPSDVSRQATLSCQDQGSQPIATLHKMVAYCQAMRTCRRKMIAEALGEQGGEGMCAGGCDICAGDAEASITIDATRYASTLVRLLRYLASKEQRVTSRQLVEAWRAKKGAKVTPAHVVGDSDRPNRLSRSTCERLVLQLLGLGVLSDDFHFTAFSVVHYVVTGARAHALESGRLPRVSFEVPEGEGKGETRAAGKNAKAKHTATSGADSCRDGGEPRARGEKDARGNGGSGSADSRPNGRDRDIKKKALGRGNNRDSGGKRASLGVDDDAAVVDLCESDDGGSCSGGDGHEKSQERFDGRKGYRQDDGGAGSAGAVGGGGGSFGGGALGDDGDSDYFEPAVKKRPRKSAVKKTKKAGRVFDDSD